MGQSFKAVLFSESNVSAYASWSYDILGKLMEHSYIGNAFTERVAKSLYQNPQNLVWMGEYADHALKPEQIKEMELYHNAWDDDVNDSVLPEQDGFTCINRVLVNHTKKQFFDCSNQPENRYGLKIHPLPLLCSCGNGFMRSDYDGSFLELVGSWAFDTISVEDEAPDDFENITVVFEEDRFLLFF